MGSTFVSCSRRVLNIYVCIQAAICAHSSSGNRASLHTNCRFKIYTQMTCGKKYSFRIDHLISTSEDVDSRCFVKVTAKPWVERILEQCFLLVRVDRSQESRL